MSKPPPAEACGFLHLADRQLLFTEERRKAAGARRAEQRRPPFEFVTISRDIGALGDVVAAALARRLEWKVYDKEIVDCIARDSHVRESLVDQLDERARNRIHDTIGHFLTAFGNDEYHVSVLKTLAAVAAQGRVVLLGRGGAFVLQGQPGLHVRVTASLPRRIERMSGAWRLPPAEARRRVLRVDEERRRFVRYHFNVDPEDFRFYHLVLNTDCVTVDQAVAAVAAVLEPSQPDAAQAVPTGTVAFRSSERDAPVFG